MGMLKALSIFSAALLKELNREEGATVVVITHDVEIANQTPRRIPIVDGKVMERKAWI